MKTKKLRFLSGLALLLGLMAVTGCSKKLTYPMPKTYPVTGELTISGKKPPVDTVVFFEPQSLDLSAQGIVDADGKFSTYMIYRGERLEGASPGRHRVAVVFPIGSDRGGKDRIVLDQEFVIEPTANNFTIAIP
jgi:hypothetical protein